MAIEDKGLPTSINSRINSIIIVLHATTIIRESLPTFNYLKQNEDFKLLFFRPLLLICVKKVEEMVSGS